MKPNENKMLIPSVKMEDLNFFIGTFKGSGNTESTLMSERRPIERKITGQADLGGFWTFIRFEDEQTIDNPKPIQGNWQLGWTINQYTGIWTDNLGRWFPQTSPGWNGNVITFVGGYVDKGIKIQVRDIFIKKSDIEMQQVVDICKDDEAWLRVLTIDLHRAH